MMLQAPLADLRAPAAPSAAPRGALVAASTGAEEFAVVLAPQDSAEQLQRLTYVCQLLRQARRPLCGINGVLTLLPFAAIDAGAAQAEELQRAVKSDLTTLQRALGLRCPVTALVTGLENERGFRELVRRVGRERARAQRFGRRFDVRSEATAAELAALCIHVCGAFEDWAYTLFREEGALTRPGNTRLYGLLCKVRCHLKTRLSQLLAAGFGRDERAAATDDPIEFSGCYFAATGPTEDRQAFVRGVFDKLVQEQEFVEWTRGALTRDARYLWLAYAGMAASAGLLVSLAWMIAARWVS
jgi:hypothetical protein